MTDQPTPTGDNRRAAALIALADAVNTGLPAPKSILFHGDSLNLDFGDSGPAAIDAWTATLGLDDRTDPGQPYPDHSNQPYPLVEPFQCWTHRAWTREPWHGFRVNVLAEEPVTDAHRKQWIDSGRAAAHAAHLAKTAGEQA